MKRILALSALILMTSSAAFATYIVVLTNGTRALAKEHWTVVNGKAIIHKEDGTTLQLDPSIIDVAKTEEVNKAGMGDVKIIATEQPAAPKQAQQSPLGSYTKLRKPTPASTPQTATVAPAPSLASSAGGVEADAINRFQAAFENVALYDAKITSPAPRTLHIELTADTEDQIFKAISATAYVDDRLPSTTRTTVDTVELFMRTVNGGSAGRFKMTREDAAAIVSKKIRWQDYFVQKVLF
ncbi:MAG TPA: hypothetical protein VHL58_04915 [Thermoanaerobaculia bacterium]|nr:hypothetical protein [Thermoanaerobaculia bacterium]